MRNLTIDNNGCNKDHSWWRTPCTSFSGRPTNPKGEIPDIYTWNEAILVPSLCAHRLLVDSLKPYCEFLPVKAGVILITYSIE